MMMLHFKVSKQMVTTIAKIRASKERQKTPVEKANSALEARRDQIDKVYNSKEYRDYLKQVPKHKRNSRDPKTPDKHDKVSSAEWNVRVRDWQQKIERTYGAGAASSSTTSKKSR